MTRILLLIDSLGPGGAQRQIVELARLLKSKGFVIKLITYHDIPFYKTVLIDNDIDIENLTKAKNVFFRLFTISRAIKGFNPNVVISFLDTPNILACLSTIFNKKYKVIVSERRYTPVFDIRARIKYHIYSLANHIVPNSYTQEEFIKKHVPKLSRKISTIINVVDQNRFSPVHHEQSQPLNAITKVAIVGTVQERKNPINVIEAAYILKQDANANIVIHWFGEIQPPALKEKNGISLYHSAISLIKEYELENNFGFFSPVSDIERIYDSYDVICLASFLEGTPNVICEAMACGKPILASNICDNHLLVKDNINGFLFDPFNPISIANAILRFHNLDKAKRESMGKNSREMAIRMFSEKEFINKYIEIIES